LEVVGQWGHLQSSKQPAWCRRRPLWVGRDRDNRKVFTLSLFVEIRVYKLKPRTRPDFHRLVVGQSVPMLHHWKVDLVAYGPSLHDDDSYFLIRAYASLEDRQTSQDAFYASDDWRRGPRQAILECIASDTSVVIEMDATTVDALRRS
jgi:hypothetical protein